MDQKLHENGQFLKELQSPFAVASEEEPMSPSKDPATTIPHPSAALVTWLGPVWVSVRMSGTGRYTVSDSGSLF